MRLDRMRRSSDVEDARGQHTGGGGGGAPAAAAPTGVMGAPTDAVGDAASAVLGDDTIQKRMQGYVQPESFTHGTAQQRMQWFKRGLGTGSMQPCDTFKAGA
jgi:predicted metalloprotease